LAREPGLLHILAGTRGHFNFAPKVPQRLGLCDFGRGWALDAFVTPQPGFFFSFCGCTNCIEGGGSVWFWRAVYLPAEDPVLG